MAVVGHWLASFLLSCLVPQASVTLLCKCTMLSDNLASILSLFRVETSTVYVQPPWMQEPPNATLELIEEWKAEGVWEKGVDLEPGEKGFNGFQLTCPLYFDASYSHSLELMSILSIPLIAYMWLRYRINAGYALVILGAMISHPLMDMVFHDAYFLMGDRSKTRVTFNLWQIPYNAPFTFMLEVAMAYFPYQAWRSRRNPINDDVDTAQKIATYEKLFWAFAIYNMLSWYVMAPIMIITAYRFTPEKESYTPHAPEGYYIGVLLFLSWSLALYPLHKLENLMAPEKNEKAPEKKEQELYSRLDQAGRDV